MFNTLVFFKQQREEGEEKEKRRRRRKVLECTPNDWASSSMYWRAISLKELTCFVICDTYCKFIRYRVAQTGLQTRTWRSVWSLMGMECISPTHLASSYSPFPCLHGTAEQVSQVSQTIGLDEDSCSFLCRQSHLCKLFEMPPQLSLLAS